MSQQVKYEFGVMSNKWTLNAVSNDYAYAAMSIFIDQDVPIAVYSPEEACFFPSHMLHSLDAHELDTDYLQKAMDSITEVQD